MSAALASFFKLSAYVDNIVLAATVAETITKPSGYSSCVITPNADCWVKRGGTAAEPSADVTDGTGARLIPAGVSTLIDLTDSAGTVLASLSIVSAAAAKVSVEWFR